jgi:hypothetical protein
VKFDIYGRFQLEVLREKGRWSVYRLTPGKRTRVHDFIIPPEVEPNEVARFLDDVFHESAVPGKTVRLLEQT